MNVMCRLKDSAATTRLECDYGKLQNGDIKLISPDINGDIIHVVQSYAISAKFCAIE